MQIRAVRTDWVKTDRPKILKRCFPNDHERSNSSDGTRTIEENTRIFELAKLVVSECCNPDVQEDLLDSHMPRIALHQHSIIQGEERSEEGHLESFLVLGSTEAPIRARGSSGLCRTLVGRVRTHGLPQKNV